MARNGSGTYSLPAGNPVVTATAISSSTHNTTMTDIETALTESIVEDGQNPFTADQPMGDNKITGLKNATVRTDAANLAVIQDGKGVYVSTVGGTADVITLTASPAITAYAAGQRFSFIAGGANTTNVTVNVNSVGAKALTKNGATALVANDILSSSLVVIEYDGTRFQLLNISDTGNKTFAGDLTLSGDNTHSGIQTFSGTIAGATPFVFEGVTADAFETSLAITDPTADRTITVPDADVDLTNVIQASATQTGFVELATEAEVQTGTDTARVAPIDTLRSGLFVPQALVTTTSGTTAELSASIPTWAKLIKINLVGVSGSGTDDLLIQLGDSGGYETSAYSGGSSNLSTAGQSATDFDTGIGILSTTGAATWYGVVTLNLIDAATFLWGWEGVLYFSNSAATCQTGGTKALSAALDRIQLAWTGSDTFDAGQASIGWM